MLRPAALRLGPSPPACTRSWIVKFAFEKRLAPHATYGQRWQNPGEYGGQRAIEVLREIVWLRNLPAAGPYSRDACTSGPSARAAGPAGSTAWRARRLRRNCRDGRAGSPPAARYRPSCSGTNNRALAPLPERRGKCRAAHRESASRQSRASAACGVAPERRDHPCPTPVHLQPRRLIVLSPGGGSQRITCRGSQSEISGKYVTSISTKNITA